MEKVKKAQKAKKESILSMPITHKKHNSKKKPMTCATSLSVDPCNKLGGTTPSQDASGKGSFIGIPYSKYNNPGGHSYWEKATPKQ